MKLLSSASRGWSTIRARHGCISLELPPELDFEQRADSILRRNGATHDNARFACVGCTESVDVLPYGFTDGGILQREEGDGKWWFDEFFIHYIENAANNLFR